MNKYNFANSNSNRNRSLNAPDSIKSSIKIIKAPLQASNEHPYQMQTNKRN